jgi:hypothetical protein
MGWLCLGSIPGLVGAVLLTSALIVHQYSSTIEDKEREGLPMNAENYKLQGFVRIGFSAALQVLAEVGSGLLTSMVCTPA